MQMNMNIYLQITPTQFLSGHIKMLGMVVVVVRQEGGVVLTEWSS